MEIPRFIFFLSREEINLPKSIRLNNRSIVYLDTFEQRTHQTRLDKQIVYCARS